MTAGQPLRHIPDQHVYAILLHAEIDESEEHRVLVGRRECSFVEEIQELLAKREGILTKARRHGGLLPRIVNRGEPPPGRQNDMHVARAARVVVSDPG